MGRTIIAAVVGGTAAAAGGGKFANGAVSAAFARLFSDMEMRKELRDGSSNSYYAETNVRWDGTVEVEYSDLYYDLPTEGLRYSVRLHEYVHAVDIQQYADDCGFLWGCFAEQRTMDDLGFYHMEARATEIQLNYLEHYVLNLPAQDLMYRSVVLDFINNHRHNLREFRYGFKYD